MASLSEDEIPVYLYGTVTQGGANTFGQDTIDTNLSGLGNHILRVHRIEYELSDTVSGDDDEYSAQVSRDSQTALLNKNNSNLISKKSSIANTNGANLKKIFEDVPKVPYIVAKDNIYLGFNTSGLSAAITVYARLECTIKKVTDAEFIKASRL